jgi:hypothetical protein
MYCKNCGKEVKEGEKFCRECGTSLDNNVTKEEKAAPIKVDNTTATDAPVNKGLAIASLVLGIASFIFGWFLLPLPIIGLILGIVQKGKCGEKTAGIILNSISLGLIIIATLVLGSLFVTVLGNIEDHCPDGECIDNVIEEIEEENNDDETGEILDYLRPWNLYKHLRQGQLGKELTLEGGWRYLGTAKEYYTFRNGEFYWYKDVDNKEDNYYYGTYTFVKGVEGISSLGITSERIDAFKKNLDPNISDDMIYSLVLTPSKLVSNGIDKSNTDTKGGVTWLSVWVLVDHGVDGIEAQVYHADDNQTAYYVKLED